MGGLKRALSVGAALGIWLCMPPKALGDGTRAHLTLERPAESFCPTADALESDVEALAGRPLFTHDAAEDVTSVRCLISEDASGVTAQLEVHAADGSHLGTRELTAPPGQCASLRRPLSLVLLMLLDRKRPIDAPSTAPEAPGERDSHPLYLGLTAGALTGALPRTSPGFGPALIASLGPRLDLRLDAAYWLPVRVETPSGTGATLQAFTLGAGVCPALWQHNEAHLSLCGGAQFVALLANPHGLDSTRRKLGAFGQGFLTLELARQWRRVQLIAALGPTLAFTRPAFLLVQSDTSTLLVHQPTRVGAMFRLTFVISAR